MTNYSNDEMIYGVLWCVVYSVKYLDKMQFEVPNCKLKKAISALIFSPYLISTFIIHIINNNKCF